MSLLTCPLCGQEQDPSGPGVSSHRQGDPATGPWISYWTPFIEDIRGTPQRLVHAKCYADGNGFDALIALITAHDRRVRDADYQQFLRDLGNREQ